jgi:Mrp family chromosome partitioning ATPase
MLILAVAGGFILAGIWVTGSEFFDHRLRDLAGVENHLHLRALGLVPLDASAFAKGRPPGRETENALSRIAATLGRTMARDGGQAIVMTGGAVGEGVTTLTAHLGRHLVRMLGLRVLLVEMPAAAPALSDVAATLSPAPAVLPANQPMSPTPPAWAILKLSTEDATPHRLKPILRDAASAFDVVLVDAPPVATDVTALLAARAAGCVLLVCSADRLPYGDLRRLCNELTSEQIEITGCVLNRYRRTLPVWLEKTLR